MATRLISLLSRGIEAPKVKHYLGAPPEVAGGRDSRREMPPAAVLVIEERPDGVFLFRYASNGEFAGDTWHGNLADAKHQASYEYGASLSNWIDVPADVTDVVGFALNSLGGTG